MGKKKINISHSIEDLFAKGSNEEKPRKNESKTNNIISKNHSIGNPTDHPQDLEIISCPTPIQTVRLTRKAYSDIIMMAKGVNELATIQFGDGTPKMEVSCYLLADQDSISENSPGIVSEIYIPTHTAAETTVKVEIEAVREVKKYIEKNNKVLLGWAHSHGHFKVYSSPTDEKNHRTLLLDTTNLFIKNNFQLKYIYGLTVVDSGDHMGVILTQYSCGRIAHEVDNNYSFYGEDYSQDAIKERYKEIFETLKKKVKLLPPVPPISQDNIQNQLIEELLEVFVRNLQKAKNLLFDELPKDFEPHFEMLYSTLKKYDGLLLDSAEEAFTQTAEKLGHVVKEKKEEI